ncbi:MAG TPA: glycosyl hydrolase family 28-related protein [Candidatus Hydrogenedentes bacterium]|nr:glycosyl hydrolase family 28-related protein [Candidatus Hydrogenedentota bacterium]
MARFRVTAVWLVAVCMPASIAWGAGEPRVIATKYPTDDVVIASAVVGPPANAEEDTTAAIQDAIDAVAEAGGGTLFLPEGRYLLKGHLLLRNAVTLRGDWQAPDEAGAVAGTILMPVEHHGNEEGDSAITMQCGSGLRELSIWYPRQEPANIVPYPWTVETTPDAGADNYTVQNVTLVNPYLGFKTGPEANELHTLNNVYMTALKTGVFIDSCTDIGRVIDIDISPRWWVHSGLPNSPSAEPTEQAVRTRVAREGTGIDMGRSDWEYLYGLHIEGYQRGLVIRQGAQGTTNAVLFGSIIENCATALLLEELNGIGLAAAGCRFEGSRHALYATKAFTTVSQFNTCAFRSSQGNGALLEGAGTVTFQNCRFEAWGIAGVEAAAGAVSLWSCAFEAGGKHVVLGEPVRLARLLGNTFQGDPSIENAAVNADVMVTQRAMASLAPDVSRPPEPPVPALGSREVLFVTGHGASPELADNTGAFQEALDAAQTKGGATVYVPAGHYPFSGSLTVPSGVELRGCFDVPHHTQSGGSVLMPVGGRGEEGGTPFIQLAERAGMRGITVWYPEQDLLDIKPYPWTVRSMGPGCWLVNVTIANAWQGVDFWTHPSDGHYISYLAGAYLKRGLFVSKCESDGWVADVQMNPHYGLRLPEGLPRPQHRRETFDAIIDQQRGNLEGIVFGRCAKEHIYRTFLYAAYDGIAFRDDDGGSNARILMHGTDTGSRCAVLNRCGNTGLEFVLAQLVPLGKYEVGAIVAEDSFSGRARFFSSQMWAGNCSGVFEGSGDIELQQLNTISGGMTCRGGAFRLENAVFQRDLQPHVAIGEGCKKAPELLGNIALTGEFRIESTAESGVFARANSVPQRPASFEPGNLSTGWENSEPQSRVTTLAPEGGGQQGVENAACTPAETKAHSGNKALRVTGQARDAEHSYIYFTLFEEPLRVYSDSQLSYWFLPENERGRYVSLDILFADGSTLRDSGTKTADGVAAHPATAKGVVGEWRQIVVPLGGHAGKAIRRIMAAYDGRSGAGPFEAFIDDFEVRTAAIPELAAVSIGPKGGAYPPGTKVSIAAPQGVRVRYSLDGTFPGEAAPLYTGPVVLENPGLWEVRFSLEREDGGVLPWVWAELYDIR